MGYSNGSGPKKSVRRFVTLGFAFVVSIGFTTCDLFKVGLGKKVDITAPSVSYTSHGSGGYVRSTITLKGDCSDDIAVASVSIAVGDKTFPATVEGGTWTAQVDTAGIADGEHNFTATASDAAGHSTTNDIFLYVDNTPPVVLIKTPSFGTSYAYNQRVSIAGGAADNVRLDSVTVTVYDASLAVVGSNTITGMPDWSYNFTAPAGASIVDYTVSVTATDKAGNVSSHFYHSDPLRTYLSGAGLGTTVPAADELVSIEKGASLGGFTPATLTALAIPAGSSSGETMRIDPNSDKPSFIISNPAETGDYTTNVLASIAHAVGMVIDDDAVDVSSIQLRVRSGLAPWPSEPADPSTDTLGWVSATTVVGSGTTVRFDHVLTGSIISGNNILQLRARDVNGTYGYSQNVSFRVESAASTISVSSPSYGAYMAAGSPIVVSGTASDPDSISSVEVLFDVAGQSFHAATGTTSWNFTSASIPANASALAWAADGAGAYGSYKKGEIPVVIRVTDGGGQQTFASLILLVDSAPPTLSINTPDLSKDQNGIISIQGIAGDDSKVETLTMTYGSTNIAGVNLGNNYAWRFSIDTTAIDDATNATNLGGGRWRAPFAIVATDAAGNSTTIGSPANYIYIDQSSDIPTISFTGFDPAVTSAGAVDKTHNLLGYGASILASVKDDDAVQASSIRLRFDGGAWRTLDADTGFASTATSTIQVDTGYAIANAAGPTNYLAPGIHYVEYSFTDDSAYKSGLGVASGSAGPIYFAIDRDSPDVVLDQSGVQLVNSAPVLSGRATDASGIKSVQVSDDSGATWSANRVNSTSVTANAATDTFTTASAHNLLADDAVAFSATSLPGGIAAGAKYYVISSGLTATAFQVSATLGGSAVNVTSAGTAVAYSGPRWTSLPADINVSTGLDVNNRKTILVRATDIYDKTTDKTVTIQVDTTPPAVQNVQVQNEGGNTFTPIAGAVTVNGTATVKGSIVEDNGLQFTRFAVVAHGSYASPAAVPDAAFTASNADAVLPDGFPMGSSSLFAWSFDLATTAAQLNNQSLDVYVWSRDTAGNDLRSLLSPYIVVDQNSDLPVISLTSLTGALATDRLLQANPTITFNVSDDDGVAASTMRIAVVPYAGISASADNATDTFTVASHGLAANQEVSFSATAMPAGLTAGTSYFVVGGSLTANTFQVSAASGGAAINFTSNGTAVQLYPWIAVNNNSVAYADARSLSLKHVLSLADGRYRFALKVKDNQSGAASAAMTPVDFYIDTAAPALNVTSPTGNSAWNGASISLSGTVLDANGLMATTGLQYQISSNPGWVNLTQAPGWSGTYTIRPSQADDGMGRTISIRATDIFGNTTQKDVTVNIDTLAPATVISSPAAASWNRGTFTISGGATDATSGVSLVQVAIDHNGDGDLLDANEGWNPASYSAGTWNFVFDSSAYSGTQIIHARSTDGIGLTGGDATRTITLDQTAPTVSALTFNGAAYTSGTVYANAAYTIAGNAADNASLASVAIERSADGGTTWASVTGTGTASWTYTHAAPAAGSYLYRITASDTAGNASAQATFAVVVDLSNPNAPVVVGPGTTVQAGDSVATSATASDVGLSGVDAVYTCVTSFGMAAPALPANLASWTQSTQSGPNWVSSLSLSSQEHKTVHFVTRDKAGNYSTESAVSFWADQSPPTVSVTAPLSGGMINNSGFLMRASASDVNGVTQVVARFADTNWADSANNKTLSWNSGNADYEYSWLAADIGSISGAQTLYVRVTDGASRTTTASVSVEVDTVNPTAAFLSPASGATVNNTISIQGTSSDNNAIQSIVLDVTKGAGAWNLTPLSGSLYSWSYSMDTTVWGNSTYGTDLGSGRYQINVRATVTDRAGNTGTSNLGFVIDQASDIPVVTLLDISANPATPSTLLGTTLRGTVTDDDGTITSMSCSLDGSTWTAPTLNGSSWRYTVSGGDGSKTLYVRVVDGPGTPFDQATAHVIRVNDDLGYSTFRAPPVSFAVDTVKPDVDQDIRVDTTPASWDAPGALLGSGLAFGGTSTGTFIAQAQAGDANGIASVNASIVGVNRVGGAALTVAVPLIRVASAAYPALSTYRTGAAISVSADNSTDTFTAAAHGLSNGNAVQFKATALPAGITAGSTYYVVNAAANTFQVSAASGGTAVNFTTNGTAVTCGGPIDVTQFVDNNLSLVFTVTDNSGLESTLTKNITIDNTAPAISFTSPANNAVVYGNVSVNGLATDNLSGLVDVSYKHGWNNASEAWTSLGSSMAWNLPFASIDAYAGKAVAADYTTSTFTATGHGFVAGNAVYLSAATMPAGLSAATTYYVVNSAPNTFQISTTVGGAAAAFTSNGSAVTASVEASDTDNDQVWNFPILIRATDTAGNMSTTTTGTYGLRINPNGDKPLVDIGYPNDDPSGLAPVGGTVRVQGTASDNELVYAVYMQIDVNNDGLYTAADVATDGTNWYNGGLGQIVTGTNNWYRNINANGEFNPVSGTRQIHIRVRAQDSKNNGVSGDVYGAWEQITVSFDNDVPQFGSSMPLMLDPDPATLGTNVGVTPTAASDTFTTGSNHGLSVGNVVYFTGTTMPGGISRGTGYFVRTVPNGTTFTVSATNGGATTDVTSAGVSVVYTAVDGDETIYSPGICINRTMYLRGSIEDEGTINSVSLTGSITGSLAANPTWFSGASGSLRVYLNMPITVSGAVSTTVNFTMTALDNSIPQRSSGYIVRVEEDSIAPTTTLTTATTIVQSNSNVKIGGLADDVGSGVSRIEAYFIRRGATPRFYDPKDYHDSLALAGGDVITVSSGATVDYPANSQYRIIIDHSDDMSLGVQDGNGDHVFDGDTDFDGYLEQLKASAGTSIDWFADINSSIRATSPGVFSIPDGPIEVHYIVYDKAGNTSHYAQATSAIQNNGPLVGAIWLGSDLDNSGTIDGTERERFLTPTALKSTNFPVKSDLMDLYVEATQGNGTLNYNLTVTNTDTAATVYTASGVIRTGDLGALQYIALNSAALNTIGDGNRTFSVEVWDSTEETTYPTSLKVTKAISCKVKRADSRSPAVAITALNLYSGSANGHIEANGIPGDTTDPKVSGEISYSGTASDNKLVSEIWMHIGPSSAPGTSEFDFPNYGFSFSGAPAGTATIDGSTYYRVATYNLTATPGSGEIRENGFIVRNDYANNRWKFSIVSSTFTQGGHVVQWKLDWNSSYLNDTAANDQNVSIVVDDALASYRRSSRTASADPYTISGTATARADDTHLADAANLTNIDTLWDGLPITVGGTATTVADYAPATGVIELASAVPTATAYSIFMPVNKPTLRCDVVPYISSIVRSMNASRSRLGKYPLRNSETGIVVNGFNFNMPTTQTATNWVRLYSAVTGGNQDTGTGVLTVQASPAPTNTSFSITTGADTNSGWLRLAVNGVEAVNNVNDNTLTSNQEISGTNALASAAWNDDRYLMLFRTGDSFAQSTDAEYISMGFDPIGNTLVGEWANSGTSYSYYGTSVAEGGTRNNIGSNYDPPTWTDVYVDADGEVHSVILNDSYSTGGNGGWYGLYTSIGTGYDRLVEWLGDDAPASPDSSDGLDEKLHQFRNPRIAVRSATNDQYVSYYDYYAKCLKYARTLAGAATYIGDNHRTDQMTVVDGIDKFGDTLAVTGAAASNTFTSTTATQSHGYTAGLAVTFSATTMPAGMTAGTTYYVISAGLTANAFRVSATQGGAELDFTTNGTAITVSPVVSPDVGMWSDIQIDDIGTGDTTSWRPVIVYYDNLNEKLKIARGTTSEPHGTAQWTIQDVDVASTPSVNEGQYLGNGSLSMKIDNTGGLHIVTRNSNSGGLYYIHAANVNGTGTYTFDPPVVIDPLTTDGSWADITLNGTTAIVSYRNGTSYNGLKYAFVASGTGLSSSDWDYMTVPAATIVADQRTNIEYTSNASAFPYDSYVAIGYGASNFQIVYVRRQLP